MLNCSKVTTVVNFSTLVLRKMDLNVYYTKHTLETGK